MHRTRYGRPLLVVLPALLGGLLLSGCGRNMYNQAKFEVYDTSTLFEDGTSSRPLVEGTVPRTRGAVEASFYTGQGESGLVTELPLPVTEEVLLRGQERYNIYCSPCHNYSGNGQGMIVQKGFVQPASFHEPRLREAPVGYYFNVITEGFGRMYSYASRIPPEDRWAIAAYIRALQFSQNAPVSELPEVLRERLESAPTAEGTPQEDEGVVQEGEGVEQEGAAAQQPEQAQMEGAQAERPLTESPQTEGAQAEGEPPPQQEASGQGQAGEVGDEGAQEGAQAPQGGSLLAEADTSQGEGVYSANCASCHQATGQGVPGAFPPIAGHAPELAAAEGGRTYLANLLLYGLQGEIQVAGQTYNGVMPAWQQLSDEELAGTLNYILTEWGNAEALPEDYAAFSPEEVAKQRGADLSAQDVYALRQELGLEGEGATQGENR